MMPPAVEQRLERLTHVVLVLDQHDAKRALLVAGLLARRLELVVGHHLGQRQAHDELAPLAGALAEGAHPPAVQLDQALHQGQAQPQAAAAVLRSCTNISKIAVQHLRVDAAAVVGDPHDGVLAVAAAGEAYAAAGLV